MSDSSIPTSPDGQPTPPPPAAPIAPAPPARTYPASSPPMPPAPVSAPGRTTQAYPGAAPTPATQPYGAQPLQQSQYSPPVQQQYAPLVPQQYGQQQYAAPANIPPGVWYPAYASPIYPAPRPASGLAITSLICGIAGVVLFWAVVPLIASIVAVITGHMALRQTKENPAIGGRGMAFAGLIMGYVMVGVLAITIVMTLISFVFFGAFTLPFLFSV